MSDPTTVCGSLPRLGWAVLGVVRSYIHARAMAEQRRRVLANPEPLP